MARTGYYLMVTVNPGEDPRYAQGVAGVQPTDVPGAYSPEAGTVANGRPVPQAPHATKVSATWIALFVSAVITVFLLIFILQNGESARFSYLGAHFSMPLGVAVLLAAVVGGLLMAVVGGVRILQVRRNYRSAVRQTRR